MSEVKVGGRALMLAVSVLALAALAPVAQAQDVPEAAADAVSDGAGLGADQGASEPAAPDEAGGGAGLDAAAGQDDGPDLSVGGDEGETFETVTLDPPSDGDDIQTFGGPTPDDEIADDAGSVDAAPVEDATGDEGALDAGAVEEGDAGEGDAGSDGAVEEGSDPGDGSDTGDGSGTWTDSGEWTGEIPEIAVDPMPYDCIDCEILIFIDPIEFSLDPVEEVVPGDETTDGATDETTDGATDEATDGATDEATDEATEETTDETTEDGNIDPGVDVVDSGDAESLDPLVDLPVEGPLDPAFDVTEGTGEDCADCEVFIAVDPVEVFFPLPDGEVPRDFLLPEVLPTEWSGDWVKRFDDGVVALPVFANGGPVMTMTGAEMTAPVAEAPVLAPVLAPVADPVVAHNASGASSVAPVLQCTGVVPSRDCLPLK